MDEKVYAVFGIIGPIVAYIFIGASIALSPWFSWEKNALSDLGHSVESQVAAIYNFGLLLAGLLVLIYAIRVLRGYAKWTSRSLMASAFLLQTVATFDEVYGRIHSIVSLLFFVSLGFASISYALERRSHLAAVAFAIGFLSWALYWAGIYDAGVAVPEVISSVAVLSWIVCSALEIYLGKPCKSNH